MEAAEPTYDELVQAREERWEKLQDRKRKEYDAARFMDRDADKTLHGVWVVYAWVNGVWNLVGFRRRRKRRKVQSLNKFFAKARRQLDIDKTVPVKIMDLHESRLRARRGDTEWPLKPPAFQPRRMKMVREKPALIVTKKWKQRATVRALKLNKKTTQFIALARNSWDRREGYLYIAPLKATQKALALQEARRIAPVYDDLRVVRVSELSEPLRHDLFRGKNVHAGVSRIVWPEVPPTFEEAWHDFLRWIDKQSRVYSISQGKNVCRVCGSSGMHGEQCMYHGDSNELFLIETALRIEWAMQSHPWLSVRWMRATLKRTKPSLVGDAPCERKSARTKQARRERKNSKHKTKKRKRSTHGTHSRSKSAKTSAKSIARAKNSSRRRSGTRTVNARKPMNQKRSRSVSHRTKPSPKKSVSKRKSIRRSKRQRRSSR